jgi:hypothetical protein
LHRSRGFSLELDCRANKSVIAMGKFPPCL